MIPSLIRRAAAILALASLAIAASAQSPVALSLEPAQAGSAIPDDFAGLSFEMQLVLPDSAGRHFFRPDNTRLIATFRSLGIRSLRVGGNTTDNPAVRVPEPADLDSLFAFARAAGVKVIFTLRLRQGDPTAAASVAKYLMDHYADDVVCFAIGNEPNIYDKTYPAYVADLKKYIAAVTAPGVAPAAVFCGPSTTPNHAEWARDLANDIGAAGSLRLITQHEYPGNSGSKVTDQAAARDQMLSTHWISEYEKIYQSFVPAATAHGLPYRLEETNSFYNGGAKDVSDTFAAALWALDYLHWWAAHGAAGLNFHTGDFVAKADETTRCWYASFWTSPAGYAVHPVGYALKAFDLGGRGPSVPAHIDANPDHLNLTAYGVSPRPDLAERTSAGPGKVGLTVTLINKEHGTAGRPARVALAAGAFPRGSVLYLTAPAGDAAATSGIQLGGASIGDDASWSESWKELPAPDEAGHFTIDLPAATAAVVRLFGSGAP